MNGDTRRFWNEEFETAPRPLLEAIHNERLPDRLRQAYEEAPLYRHLWDEQRVSPADYGRREDLSRFPVVRKDQVRDYRAATGEAFGGLAGPLQPASVVSRSSGTSGAPTFQLSSPRDIETIAQELASDFWAIGIRSGDIVMSGTGVGNRPDVPIRRALELIGAVSVLGDTMNLAVFVEQIAFFQPHLITMYPGFLERLLDAASAAGKDPKRLLEALKFVWYTGKRLMPLQRKRLTEELQAEVFDVGGMGDLGLLMADCSAHQGMHLREDYFVVESLDTETGLPQSLDLPGELAFTSLVDQSMNYIRWGSEDLGKVDTTPCACGRTTARITIYGRVWERTEINGKLIMPGEVEELILTTYGRECAFQLVRNAKTGAAVKLRITVPTGGEASQLGSAIGTAFGASLELEPTTEADIVGAALMKYRQVVDADPIGSTS